MIYTAKKTLFDWVLKYQKKILKVNIFSIFFMLFIGLAIFAGSNGGFNSDIKFGLSGVIVIMMFFLYIYIRSASIFNRIIKEIEKNESNVIIRTFGFRIFGLFYLKEKEVKTDFKRIRFTLNEFPLKENKNALPCYFLKLGEDDFYLFDKEFDESILDDLIKVKKE